jgi:hypothetical protein
MGGWGGCGGGGGPTPAAVPGEVGGGEGLCVWWVGGWVCQGRGRGAVDLLLLLCQVSRGCW